MTAGSQKGEWNVHGGRLDAARVAWPDAPLPWLDLSTGINPEPWDMSRAGQIDWRALPSERGLAELEAVAGAFFGVQAAEVGAVPGTEIGLRFLDAMELPAPFRHVVPCYRTHEEAFAGSTPIRADALAREADCGGTILLANPNNPDGRVLSPAVLLGLIDRLDAAGGCLVVDEAFADVRPHATILTHGRNAAVVLRSFGKFFGLAGVRLGFVVAAPDRVRLLRARLGSWPVSAAAIAIGTSAYQDEGWIAQARDRIAAMAGDLDAVLRRHGLVPQGDCPLFRLVETPDASALFGWLARRGILTRPFDHAPTWLRIGLPANGAALVRLDRALGGG